MSDFLLERLEQVEKERDMLREALDNKATIADQAIVSAVEQIANLQDELNVVTLEREVQGAMLGKIQRWLKECPLAEGK